MPTEVMVIGRTFEESLQKAIRQVDPRWTGFEVVIEPEDLDKALTCPTDMRLFAIAYVMYKKNYTVDRIHDLTKIGKAGLLRFLFLSREDLTSSFSGTCTKLITSFRLSVH